MVKPIVSHVGSLPGCEREIYHPVSQCSNYPFPTGTRPAIEDIELSTWVSAAGHRIVLDRQIQATHLKRWTLWNLLKTDIFARGVPWMSLMLRAGGLADTLNVKRTQRFSVVLVYLLALSLVAAVWW